MQIAFEIQASNYFCWEFTCWNVIKLPNDYIISSCIKVLIYWAFNWKNVSNLVFFQQYNVPRTVLESWILKQAHLKKYSILCRVNNFWLNSPINQILFARYFCLTKLLPLSQVLWSSQLVTYKKYTVIYNTIYTNMHIGYHLLFNICEEINTSKYFLSSWMCSQMGLLSPWFYSWFYYALVLIEQASGSILYRKYVVKLATNCFPCLSDKVTLLAYTTRTSRTR
jgi:hypothetical protein